jgi:hypothetical protein
MPDYSHLFGKDVAQGLGLVDRRQLDPEEAARAYRRDPAAAFTQAAAFAQPPGDAVPIPFVSVPNLLTPSNKE